MKEEPLDNKICIADGIAGCYTFKIRTAKSFEVAQEALNEQYFRKADIKSAVEWLENEFNKRDNNEHRVGFHILMRQAFPDLFDLELSSKTLPSIELEKAFQDEKSSH